MSLASLSLLGVATLATALAPAAGPDCTPLPRSDSALAHRFAPHLLFAPGERDFPTLPFHTAFDGVGGDFEAPSEVAPLDPAHDTRTPHVSWDSLHAPGGDPTEVSLRAVMYRVRSLTEEDRREMWRFLLKDVQASRRFGLEARWPTELREATRFKVVEYYMYYLDDTGLQGHEQDIEFVFVFVPDDPEAGCRFRIVVGAGHDPRTPNNVLVRFDGEPLTRILVELGGHASAPQLDDAPGLQIGRDVNWHADAVWGTRDILAVTGMGFSGRYQAEMTFRRSPRDGSRAVTEGDRPTGSSYYLVPIEPLRRLSEATAGPEADRAAALQALAELDPVLPFERPDSLSDEVLARVRAWSRPMRTGDGRLLDAKKHRPWEHRHFVLSPVLIFKEHLFRPSVEVSRRDLTELLTFGFGGVPNEAYELHVGFVVPTFYIPLSLPGFFELQTGLVRRDVADWGDLFGSLWFGGLYDNSYRDRFGWYVRTLYSRDRSVSIDEAGRSDWVLGAGASLLLWSFDRRRVDPLPLGVNALRVRVGPRADVTKWNRLFERFGLEVQVSLRQ